MTIELMALLVVMVVLFVSIFAQQISMDRKYGAKFALSNRTSLETEISPLVERLTRNVRNHVEGLALFAPLVFIAISTDSTNSLTLYASIVYAIARLLHFVFYAFAITPFRSFAWGIGFLGALPVFMYGLIAEIFFA